MLEVCLLNPELPLVRVGGEIFRPYGGSFFHPASAGGYWDQLAPAWHTGGIVTSVPPILRGCCN